LENGKFGKLVPVGNAIVLADALDEALDSPAEKAMLRKRAMDFHVSNIAMHYLRVAFRSREINN